MQGSGMKDVGCRGWDAGIQDEGIWDTGIQNAGTMDAGIGMQGCESWDAGI